MIAKLGEVADVFRNTLLVRPSAPDNVPNTGIVSGGVLGVILLGSFFGRKPRFLFRCCVFFLVIGIVCALAIIPTHWALDRPLPQARRDGLVFLYDALSAAFLICVIQAFGFTLLYTYKKFSSGDDGN